MKQIKVLAVLTVFLSLHSPFSRAQANPTATQQLQIAAFGAATGTFTDLLGGKNLGITAGVDLTLLHYRLLRPSLEIRGTYPIDKGHVDAQKNFLGGVKVEHSFGSFRPYADFLIGRGQIDYLNGGHLYQNLLYLKTASTVYSPGVGLDYDLTPSWALKADLQYQRWHTPATPSGVLNPKALTFGATYRFDLNPRHHRSR